MSNPKKSTFCRSTFWISPNGNLMEIWQTNTSMPTFCQAHGCVTKWFEVGKTRSKKVHTLSELKTLFSDKKLPWIVSKCYVSYIHGLRWGNAAGLYIPLEFNNINFIVSTSVFAFVLLVCLSFCQYPSYSIVVQFLNAFNLVLINVHKICGW
jgi:hypothetical protein